MSPKTILFVGEDPGGVDVLVPLTSRLGANPEFDCQILSRGHGNAVWERHGIPYTPLQCEPGDESAENKVAIDALSSSAPDLLVSASSYPGRLEKRFRKAARKKGIPSVTVMDADRTDHYIASEEELSCRGDYVLSITERMTGALIDAGYSAERILTTGHLGYGQIIAEGQAITPESLASWTEAFREAHDGRKLITIFSDNISEVFGGEGAKSEIGYHELDVVPALVRSIAEAAERDGRLYEVVVKLHPKEIEGKFDTLRESVASSRIALRIVRQCDNIPLILSSDRIFGMYSIIMVWSALLGKPTFSAQPLARKKNFLATAEEGWTPVHWQWDGLDAAIRRFLLDDDWYEECRRHMEDWRPPLDGLQQAEQLIARLATRTDMAGAV